MSGFSIRSAGTQEHNSYSPVSEEKNKSTGKGDLGSRVSIVSKEGSNEGVVNLAKDVKVAARILTDSDRSVRKDRWNRPKDIIITDSSGQKAAVKVKDVAKTLYISESHVRKAAKKGEQEEFLSHIGQSLESYREKFENFEAKTGELTHKKTRQQIGLTKKQLMKTTSTAFLSLKENESTFVKLGIFKGKALVIKAKDGELTIARKVKPLGKGSFGKVSQYVTASDGSFTAVKFDRGGVRHKDLRNRDMEDVKNEYNLLKFIHGDKASTRGIQDKPHSLITIQPYKLISRRGYMGVLYEGDGRSIMKNPELRGKEAIDVMHQLFSGLNTLQSQNIKHSDIKPENMLIRRNPNSQEGKFVVHLSDFGGAKQLIDKKNSKEFVRDSYTEAYTCKEDDEKIESLKKQLRDGAITTKEYKNEVREILFKGDVYSTALSLCEIMTGQVDNPDPAKLKELGIPDNVVNLMQSALSANYKVRPTPEEFLDALRSNS